MHTPDPSLTPRQRQVFEFVRDRILRRGFGPTVREIADAFEIKSPNGVICHLRALEKKGLITRQSNISRAIQLADSAPEPRNVSYLGTAATEEPFRPAVSTEEHLNFEGILGGLDRATICIEGDAYQALGIENGDHLIISRTAPGRPDNLLAALNDRHHLVLCRIPDDGGVPIPAVPDGDPAPSRQILGVVVAVVRCMTTEHRPKKRPNGTSHTHRSGTSA